MTDYRYKLGGWETMFDYDLVTGKYHTTMRDMLSAQEASSSSAAAYKSKDLTSLSVPVQQLQHQSFGYLASRASHPYVHSVPRVEQLVKHPTKNCKKT